MTILFTTLGLPHEKARHTAELINDYDPELHLERLPEGSEWLQTNPDRPYAVIHRPVGLPEYIIESFSAAYLDERVFARVLEWDTRRFGKQLDKFDALAHAQRIARMKADNDRFEEDSDKMAFLLNKRRWE